MKRTALEELILLKTLEYKRITRNDYFHEEVIDADVIPTKNVCAKVPLALVERLDDAISRLSMSKRLFIETAITQALDLADQIWIDEGVDHATLHEGYKFIVTENAEPQGDSK